MSQEEPSVAEALITTMQYLTEAVVGLKAQISSQTTETNGLGKTLSLTNDTIFDLGKEIRRLAAHQEETNKKLDNLLKWTEAQKEVNQIRDARESLLTDAVRKLTAQLKTHAELMEKSMLNPAQNLPNAQAQTVAPQTPVMVQLVPNGTTDISKAQKDAIANDIKNMLAFSKRTPMPDGSFVFQPIEEKYISQWRKSYCSYLKHVTGKKPEKMVNWASFQPGIADFELELIRNYNQAREQKKVIPIVAEVMNLRPSELRDQIRGR